MTHTILSLEERLKKDDLFWCRETSSIIKVSKLTENGFSHALKTHFTRQKIHNPYIQDPIYICAFCGRPNATWFFLTKVDDKKQINILGIDYAKPIHYCFQKGPCPGKKLNPNSIEYVSKTRHLSEEEAIKLIHDRNMSPFYRDNHTSDAEYKSYQGTRLTEGKSPEEFNEIIKKQNHARSIKGYVEKYGQEGRKKWKAVQISKGITVENLEKKYGREKAEQVVNAWRSQIGPSLPNFVRRYGKVKGLEKFREFHAKIKINKDRTNAFGVVSHQDGHVLRSNLERRFYSLLMSAGFTPTDFSCDGHYPESLYRYDFYFHEIDTYVEIAGLTTEEYENKLKIKADMFNPLIIRPQDFTSGRVGDIIDQLKNLMGDSLCRTTSSTDTLLSW